MCSELQGPVHPRGVSLGADNRPEWCSVMEELALLMKENNWQESCEYPAGYQLVHADQATVKHDAMMLV